jgi:hypothetical protein
MRMADAMHGYRHAKTLKSREGLGRPKKHDAVFKVRSDAKGSPVPSRLRV